MKERDAWMLRRADRGGRMAQPVREDGAGGGPWGGPSVVELVRQRLVEHEGWHGLDVGGIEGRSLVEQEVALRGSASG